MITNYRFDVAFINELHGGLYADTINNRSVIAISINILERSINLIDQLHQTPTFPRRKQYQYLAQIKHDIEYVKTILADVTHSHRLMSLIANLNEIIGVMHGRIHRCRLVTKYWRNESIFSRIYRPLKYNLIVHRYIEDLHFDVLIINIKYVDYETRIRLRQEYIERLDYVSKQKHHMSVWKQIDELMTKIEAI